MTRLARAASALAITLVMGWSAQATAEVQRYAVVVGNNVGEPDDVTLSYAERDARRVGEVLRDFGGIPNRNIMRLYGATSGQLLGTLEQMERTIADAREASPDDEQMLVFYYSGHADRRAMHMTGTRMEFKALRQRLEASSAKVRIVMIDACRSGELTRVKGAAPAEPFRLEVMERSDSEGMAIITSSSANEESQESDRIEGSFFTHHLIAGLLGAADRSGDARVSLSEAYQYAYAETLRTTSRMRYIQHPTYSFQIRGRQDVILTRLRDDGNTTWGRLALDGEGFYMLFTPDASGRLVTELTVEEAAEIAVTPGTYFVRRRLDDAIFEGSAEVRRGAMARVDARAMRRVPYAQVVRKGSIEDARRAVALRVGGFVEAPAFASTAPLLGAGFDVQTDTEIFTLTWGLRFAQNGQSNDFLTLDQRFVGTTVGALKMWDVRAFSFGLGATVGADFIEQRFTDTVRLEPTRRNVRWRFGPVAHLSFTPTAWGGVFLEGGADATAAPVADMFGASALDTRINPFGRIGVHVYLP
ncbi:MAG: caspase family protein [Myxococcota bacterium]